MQIKPKEVTLPSGPNPLTSCYYLALMTLGMVVNHLKTFLCTESKVSTLNTGPENKNFDTQDSHVVPHHGTN